MKQNLKRTDQQGFIISLIIITVLLVGLALMLLVATGLISNPFQAASD